MSTFVYDFAQGNKDQTRPARRQGRQPRRDDQPRAARPPGLHDHHRGLPRLPRGRAASPTAWPRRSTAHLAALEEAMGRRLGDPHDPLLVSVRSGAKFSMPGMMETVLNIGLNDESVAGPGGAERRRAVRAGLLPPAAADVRHHRARHRRRGVLRRARRAQGAPGHHRGHRPRRRRPARAGRVVQAAHRGARRPRLPAGPARADGPRGARRSSTPGTPSAPCSTAARSRSPRTSAPRSTSRRWSSATAAPTSGSGVGFTRDPASGNQGVYGDYLQNAQGEDVVAGIRNTVSLADMGEIDQAVARRAARDHGDARAPLPRHVRHRVHRRARQAVDAADPGRQAHPRGGVPDRRCTWPTRA